MAYTFPSLADVNDENYDRAYEYEERLTSTGVGLWIICPTGVIGAHIELETSTGSGVTGSGYIETTLDPIHYVKANIAVAKTWSAGTVSSTLTREYSPPVAAIRAVNISGTIRLKIRFQ